MEEICMGMKNNKCPGENGIKAENLKYRGDRLKGQIFELVKEIWKSETMPMPWKKANIVPIYKKGDKTKCGNYRGIAVLDVAYKIFATLIKRRLEEYTERFLGEYQSEFRRNRSTSDQIFTLKQILTGAYEYEIPYDSVNRIRLIYTLREFKIPGKIVKMTLESTTCAVKVNGKLSADFQVSAGLRKGDPLSTVLFNIVLEK